MPNTKSAKKRLKQSLVRRQRNRGVKSALKTEVRKVRAAIAAGDVEQGAIELRVASKKLDQAASKHVLHRNAAARVKSRLSAALKAAKLAGPKPAAVAVTRPAKAAKAGKGKTTKAKPAAE